MRCFLNLAANAVLGALTGFGVAEAAALYGFAPLFHECTGLIGAFAMACARRCVDSR
jgi:hypothetical protein